jgi:hypothetical protein
VAESGAMERRHVTARRLAMLVGFFLGASAAAIAMALVSDECAGMRRSLTLFPPGLRCIGPKDDARVPWGTEGPAAVPLVLAGGLVGVLLVVLVLRLLASGSESSRVDRARHRGT